MSTMTKKNILTISNKRRKHNKNKKTQTTQRKRTTKKLITRMTRRPRSRIMEALFRSAMYS